MLFSPDGIRLMQLNGEAAGQTVPHLHMHIVPCYADIAPRAHAQRMADSSRPGSTCRENSCGTRLILRKLIP